MALESVTPSDHRSRTSLRTGISLVAASLGSFLRLVFSRQLRLRIERVGLTSRVCDARAYRVFRETVRPLPDKQRSVIEVGFRLRLIRSVAASHWLFQRVCILTTPFWSGFEGFGTKLWMVDPATRSYAGIYQWGDPSAARRYLSVLLPALGLVSVRGSVFSEIHEDVELGRFLSERAQTVVTSARRGA